MFPERALRFQRHHRVARRLMAMLPLPRPSARARGGWDAARASLGLLFYAFGRRSRSSSCSPSDAPRRRHHSRSPRMHRVAGAAAARLGCALLPELLSYPRRRINTQSMAAGSRPAQLMEAVTPFYCWPCRMRMRHTLTLCSSAHAAPHADATHAHTMRCMRILFDFAALLASAIW